MINKILIFFNYSYKPKLQNKIDNEIRKALKRDAEIRRTTGGNLVQVTSHGESCEICKQWENYILVDDVFMLSRKNKNYHFLSEAINQGLFHKGCRHGITTYYPELKNVKYK